MIERTVICIVAATWCVVAAGNVVTQVGTTCLQCLSNTSSWDSKSMYLATASYSIMLTKACRCDLMLVTAAADVMLT